MTFENIDKMVEKIMMYFCVVSNCIAFPFIFMGFDANICFEHFRVNFREKGKEYIFDVEG